MGEATHGEEQGRDGGAAFHVDHGQQAGEVALSGSGEEQPANARPRFTRRKKRGRPRKADAFSFHSFTART